MQAAVVAGAVLCGGRSSRMGTDKSLLEVGGVPMARRVADALAAAGCARVVAIGGDADGLGAIGLEQLPDGWPGEGPLGGVITALRSLAESTVVVAVACDLPRLTARAVSALTAALAAHPSADVAVGATERLQPLCAAWRPSALPLLEREFECGERRLHAALEQLDAVRVSVDPEELLNVNAPGDVPSRL